MQLSLLRTVVPALLAGGVACSACADIFTWVDASGRTNVSNIEPPAGMRVIGVQRTNPAAAETQRAFREAARQSEVQALEERVRELQDQVSAAARQPPQKIELHVVMAPPAPVYVEPAPTPVFYDSPAPPQAFSGCDPSWLGCSYWWNSGFYPASVIVAGSPGFGRHHPVRGGRPSPRPGIRAIAPPGRGPIPPPLVSPTGSWVGSRPLR